MSENPNHNKQYSVAEIQAYLDGRMSSKEMFELEKAALDDPFLADAIEGVQAARTEYTDNVINQHLQKTEEALADRLKQAPVRRIGFWGWRQLAAAALVLLVAGVWIYKNYNKPENSGNEIALEPVKKEVPASSPADNPEKDSINSPVTTWSANPDSNTNRAIRLSQKKEYAVVAKDSLLFALSNNKEEPKKRSFYNYTPASPSAKQADLTKGDDFPISKDSNINTADAKDHEALERSATSPAQMNVLKNAMVNRFNGRVLDTNKKPLAFASVYINNQKNGVTTDQNGYFSLAAPDSVLTVNVTSIGYVTQNFQLNQNNSLNQLTLTPSNNNLNEVVVTGMGVKRKSRTDYFSRNPKVLIQDAEPVNGWIEYQKYLDTSNTLRDTTSDEEVVVSFVVDKAGKLSNFKIEQSLSDKEDAEALRLIKEGPAWHLLRGKRAKVIVMVRF